jgi:hypothetical protein
VNAVDPDGKTVWSALDLISLYRTSIWRASVATGGVVTPMEIARVIFQENRNDYNWRRYDDRTGSFTIGFLGGIGGPEAKNLLGGVAAMFGKDTSLGIGEMKISTAARLLGYDPSNPIHRATIMMMLRDRETAILLVGMELKRIKEARPGISTEVLLSDYNRGLSSSDDTTEVGLRSGGHLGMIARALGMDDATAASTIVRCNGAYHFANQCQ